jgi:hypothetical protein
MPTAGIPNSFAFLEDVWNPRRAIERGILGVQMKMDEGIGRHGQSQIYVRDPQGEVGKSAN